nr:hypothetical protein HK105_002931 [Polyrhizophydium stewartii]
MLWSSPLAARRRVFVGLPQPAQLSASEGRPLARFPPNRIRTSKYTLVTFLPKNLFEQFRRGLPIFQISSTPWIPALPLIVIVTVTAIKDLVEDYRRQVSDRQLNNASALILRDVDNPNYPRKEPRQARTDSAPESVTKLLGADACNWGSTTWNALRVGDFVLLPGGSRVPADIILLSSSHLDGVAFVETKNLDGETNLKTVEAIPETAEFRTGADCRRLRLIIDSEPPSINLYSYNAAICVFPPDEPPLTAEQMLAYGDMNSPLPANPRPLPVNASNLLLRGSVVRNIDYVIGVVVFTGQDTKVILNAGATPSKRSNIEKRMNLQVAINFVILLALCLSITLLEGYSLRPRAPKPPSELLNYLNNTVASKVIVFGASIIMLQNIVPISLYVTLEFIKSFQSFFIYQDIEMYDEELDETCIPKSWNITDDLGQIEYIFSDKASNTICSCIAALRC